MLLDETIAAISTPPGEGGISIIRISGEKSIEIADKIYIGPKGKNLSQVNSHTINYGHITDEDGTVIDEVLVSVMKAPHTYTGENVVEINCHGGIVSTRRVLERALSSGAHMASPGEFTKRAFLNGRIDLSQAESVMDIISSKTNLTHTIAVNQLGGRLSAQINGLREALLSLLAHIQVLIDYADGDLEPLSDEQFLSIIDSSIKSMEQLLGTADRGRLIRNGIMTAIVGKPNVGKSSLLNLLSGEERAIVTDIEGTTRDAIEEYITLGDVALRIIDTAGIRNTDDVIENIGVDKSKKYMTEADLVLFMLDGKKELDENDKFIIENLNSKNTIAIINKTEDGCAFDPQIVCHKFPNTVMFSVHHEKGIGELEKTVKNLFEIGSISENNDSIITNIRHKEALEGALGYTEAAREALLGGIPQDMISIDIENAISSLGEIVGQTVSEEVVDKIFHNFCLGK